MGRWYHYCLQVWKKDHWLICAVEGEGVASEVYDILAQVKLFVNVPHRCSLGVDTLHGSGVVLVKVGNKDQELSEAPFFKQPHQTLRRRRVETCWTCVKSNIEWAKRKLYNISATCTQQLAMYRVRAKLPSQLKTKTKESGKNFCQWIYRKTEMKQITIILWFQAVHIFMIPPQSLFHWVFQ